ncbi:DUF4317 domain-containing protein [Amphibacillus cookii]|uniref:DUF4317 domain-containing protein n=1 Tax=Amphibacillus cookii TaxID=767787 RepID=UPI001959CE2F|nr:DUF4317 domain-containing protein [Amphibacillus cookii]MBM7541053.1 hypothetical protein [Amphibacillus cookii]
MNKKDIAHIRKQFKRENDLLHISEIFNVYIMKESSEIYHQVSRPFSILDQDEQELFLANFKKVLTGSLDEKLFELKFQADLEDSSQLILHQALLANEGGHWQEQMLKLVEKMLNEREYDMDIVVTFIKGDYLKPIKKRNDETEESDRDAVYSHNFILCTINKTQDPKKELLFDYVEKQFKYNVIVDPIINLKAPIGGFLFPCFIDQASDVNHILYSAPKANEPDPDFINDVLNAEESTTAQEDKIIFEEIVRDAVGHQLNTSTLANVYQEVHRIVEENEAEDDTPKLDYKDVEQVLKHSGIETVDHEKLQTAFQNVVDNDQYELKAKHIVPKYNSKSIKINTKVANVAVSPEDLRFVKQIHFSGKRYLMIEVEEDTVIDGFTMIPEVFGEKSED